MKLLIISAILLLSLNSFCQQKFEKEERIDASEVPQAALSFIENLDLSKKIKWYRETGLNSVSFEAKTRHNSKLLSVEFSKDGSFEDLEITTNEDAMPAAAKTKIKKYLVDNHAKYKFDKIQTQFIGEINQIKALVKDFKSSNSLTVNYEIVISTKEDGSFVLYEYLFDAQGKFISRARIIQKMTDNIEY